MTPLDVLTKSKVLRKRSPSLRNRYKLELIWEWKSNISLKANKQKLYLHNANEIILTILFDTFHDVWVHMFAIIKLRGNWGEKNRIVITCSNEMAFFTTKEKISWCVMLFM